MTCMRVSKGVDEAAKQQLFEGRGRSEARLTPRDRANVWERKGEMKGAQMVRRKL